MKKVIIERWITALKAAERAEELTDFDRQMVRNLIRCLEAQRKRLERARGEEWRWKLKWEAVEAIGYALWKSRHFLKFIAKWFANQS